MDTHKVSVIIPAYNVEPYFRKCLDSVVEQTYRDLEIILVDDGSPDKSGAICDEYAAGDDRIKVIHQANGGVSSARNAGLDAATGDWISFVDADDWIEPDMIQYLLEGALSHRADIAVCGMRKTGVSVHLRFRYTEEQVLNREQALRAILENRSMTLSCCDKLAKRELWDGLRFSDLKIGEDLLAMGRLLDRADTVVRLPENKYNYLTRLGSALTDDSLEARLDCWQAAIRQYEELCPKWPQLKIALAGRSAAAAVGVWGVYLSNTHEEREKYRGDVEEIAAFVRGNPAAVEAAAQSLGMAGRMVVRLTSRTDWRAFAVAGIVNWLYQARHKRPL